MRAIKLFNANYFGKAVSMVIVLSGILVFTSCNSSTKQSAGNADTITSLAAVYEGYFTIGAAVSTRTLDDSASRVILQKQFNSITAENEMKWEKIHPEPDLYTFESADKFVAFGEANNMEIIGHVLIWHAQTPKWVFQDSLGNEITREALLERMKEHIHTVVKRYKGRVHAWDVVNEAVTDTGGIRESMWYKIIGEDFIQKAFEYAHEADPDAILIYNDYSLATAAKRNGTVELVKSLKESGTRIDVVGMQGHYHLDYPEPEELEASIKAFADAGVKVMITELDINILPMPEWKPGADIALNFEYDAKLNPYTEGLPDSMQVKLAERYVSFFKIFNEHKEVVDRVTFWGIQDGDSWLNYWPVRGRTNYPLLFDRNYQPKQAFWAVAVLPEE